MEKLAKLPIFLDLDRKNVLVAGTGSGAVWKVRLLTAAGAHARVFADDPSEEMLALCDGPASASLFERPWNANDFENTAVALLEPTGQPGEIERFRDWAKRAGALINVIDTPAACDFQFGTIVNRFPAVIGISTDGAAPILAQAIRRRIEAILPPALGAWTAAAKDFRSRAAELLPDRQQRREFWEAFVDSVLDGKNDRPAATDLEAIARYAKERIEPNNPPRSALLTELSVHPSDPGHLTLATIRTLQAADAIVYDAGISAEVLSLSRREAQRIAATDMADIQPRLSALRQSGAARIVLLHARPGSPAG